MILEDPVQRLPHGGKITPATTSEPLTSDQQVDFGLVQLDPDAAQPFLTPVSVAAHSLGTERARPRWLSLDCPVGHDALVADPHPEILPEKLHHRHGKRNVAATAANSPTQGARRTRQSFLRDQRTGSVGPSRGMVTYSARFNGRQNRGRRC